MSYDHTSTPLGRASVWVEDRVGGARWLRGKLGYVFPEHFSFLFGEIALYSFLVLVVSGTFLALFYSPSEARTIYDGAYGPLQGVEVTEAYASVLELSFSVRAGLLLRQTHHWAALVFLGAIFVHLARVFFTGAFRRPRELNWMTGVVLMFVAMIEGFAGYSLLDDLLSGTGLRIGESVAQSIPVVGEWMAFIIWGGEYPGEGFLQRLFVVHVFLIPAVLAGLMVLHLALIVRQHHTQFPGRGRTERNVVGSRMWPTYLTLSLGLFLLVGAGLVAMGAFAQINPVWLYGPYDPYTVSSGAQADFYVLWLQGALRLWPGWSIEAFGFTIPEPFVPGILLPGIIAGGMLVWPFIEAWRAKDHREHHLLDRPRDVAVRIGFGAGVLTLFVILLIAGSDDIIAAEADWSVVTLRYVERVLAVVLPVVVGLAAARVARDLAAKDPLPELADEPPDDPLVPTDPVTGEAAGAAAPRGQVPVPASVAAGRGEASADGEGRLARKDGGRALVAVTAAAAGAALVGTIDWLRRRDRS